MGYFTRVALARKLYQFFFVLRNRQLLRVVVYEQSVYESDVNLTEGCIAFDYVIGIIGNLNEPTFESFELSGTA